MGLLYMTKTKQLLLALLVSLPVQAMAQVAVDSTGTQANNFNGSDISWTHTLVSSGDVLVLVMATGELNAVSINSATFDSNAMTLIDYQNLSSGAPTMALWYYHHTGSSGGKTVSIDFQSGARLTGASIALTGIDTGASYSSGDLTTDDGSAATSVSGVVSSATDDLVLGFLSLNNGLSTSPDETITAGANQTQRANIQVSNGDCGSYISSEPGGSSITMSESWSSSVARRYWALSIDQGAGGGSILPILNSYKQRRR